MSAYNSNTKILSAFYQGNFIAKGYAQNRLVFDGELVTLYLSPSESDATIQFSTTGAYILIGINGILVRKGTTVNYTISKEHYRTVQDSYVVQSTTTLNIPMVLDYRINVEDYEYTTDNVDNVVLTKYIGSNTDVIVPEIVL